MGRLAVAAIAAALFAAPGVATAKASASWAQPQIQVVTAHGLMGGDPASFRPDDSLTAGDLADLVAGLTKRTAAPAASPSTLVTVAGLDMQLVRALGLADSAKAFADGARASGLNVPPRFGTEAVARLLGLRVDHPAAQDSLELAPSDPATRAEAAYSAAKILSYQGWEVPWVRELAAGFAPPSVTGWQGTILQAAVDLIGYPYIWGGSSETTQAPFGFKLPGGFDCSGFAWRIYKLSPYPGGDALASTLQGRTTYDMSTEVPRRERISYAALQPADVVFFGDHGPRSKKSEVDHMGIYLGGGWFIHSSGQGVSIAPLVGTYKQRFAWGRRPLAEAGLVP